MLMQHFINILASTSKGRSEIYLHIQKLKKNGFIALVLFARQITHSLG